MIRALDLIAWLENEPSFVPHLVSATEKVKQFYKERDEDIEFFQKELKSLRDSLLASHPELDNSSL